MIRTAGAAAVTARFAFLFADNSAHDHRGDDGRSRNENDDFNNFHGLTSFLYAADLFRRPASPAARQNYKYTIAAEEALRPKRAAGKFFGKFPCVYPRHGVMRRLVRPRTFYLFYS